MTNKGSFFSISGRGGIVLGLILLLTVYLLFKITDGYAYYGDGFSQLPIFLLEIAIIVLTILATLICLIIIWYRAKRRAKKSEVKLWSKLAKKQRLHLLVPLFVLGLILIIIANKGYYNFITPLSLAFYGLILLNMQKFGSNKLIALAIAQLLLALAAYFIVDKEFIFLGLGFGVLTIIYGLFTLNQKKQP